MKKQHQLHETLWGTLRGIPRALQQKVLNPQLHLERVFELRFGQRLRSERGDVPGWILITLMTSGLVVLIWALAGPALADIFDQAIRRVTGSIR